MNQLNDKARLTAEKLLSKFGATATLSKVIAGVYNPLTQTVVNTSSSHTISTYPSKPDSGMISSGLATGENIVFLVSAKQLGVIPLANDTLTFNSKAYTVVRDIPIYGGSDIALHQLVCMAV